MKIVGNQKEILFKILNAKKMFGCVMAVTMISRPPSSQSADDDEPDDYWSGPDETGEVGQECTGPGGTSCSFSRVCLGVCVWPLADWLCYETCQSAHTRVFPIIHPCPLPFARSSAPTSLPYLLCCHLKGQIIFSTKYLVFSVTFVYAQIHFNFQFNS